tara:strand:- start:591 stop:929 length:339 start_codon:yes stop_codon:yes gene_type:complete
MATNYNLNITQGSDFNIRLAAKDENGTPIDLTNYSVSGQAKRRYSDATPLLNLSPSKVDGYLASGYIDINIPAETGKALPVVQGVYDVEIYSGTYHQKVVQGRINVYPEVTS